ncbi:Gryzun, putative trafficking through golgi-domain-containing protein [Bombardia bombarda]|uniref:Gryzun, putative trafficking through golgi-domain-containing protein n=1 Tax=Bombardia bombarda TaxID=252184 RepID=A0AA40C8X0_9PEZI|nr:Gryzun, putative trafficking through golgi-domain-containing protein [Bombardia bombarda]
MDEYPAGSLDHTIPFLLALGVSASSTFDSALSPALKEQASLIRSSLPTLETDQAHALLDYIQDRDASQLPCNGRESERRYRFRVRTAERSFLLPPRRARIPDGIETPPFPPVLHSPFSPLSPVSSLYPDGLIDAQWTRKHQELIPSVLLCFYTLATDPSLATLCDNQIKTDVNNIRGLLSQSGYKTRLAVVLLSDRVAPSVDGIQERLDNIRKGCGIDSKTFFLVPPNDSREDLERMAENMLVTLHSVAIEYYRDMGRHSRKKRGRGVAPQPTVPPTSGTSQTLSLAGWNVRYDYKSAMFAEYRLDMDNALRSFEQAYENLLSSELMEVIPSWSPRWNEARMLADVIAVRCLRCLLWNSQYSAASRRWQFHRERIADLVERRGRGTSNYGWEAWEARWATVVANLIEKADITDFAPSTFKLYLQPEKSAMGERLQPWELLHHTGYWYRLASRHLYARRSYAHAMPEDDRRPPSFSPASRVAGKAFTYDTYMCPDPHEEYPIMGQPGVDHSQLIVDCLIRARSEFRKRNQIRLAAELSLECARELALIQDWPNIVELLRPLWLGMSFRTEGWLTIAEELCWALRTAAAMAGEADLVLAIDWELLNQSFTRRSKWHYDITRSLEGMTPKTKPSIHVRDDKILSFISASFLFKDEEGKAGQSIQGQLAIKSNAHQGSAPIVFNSLEVEVEGSVRSVILRHQEDGEVAEQKQGGAIITAVTLTEATDDSSEAEDEADRKAILQGTAPLSLLPGQTLVFAVEIPLREPGETNAMSLKLKLQTESFDLQHSLTFQGGANANRLWYFPTSTPKRISRTNPLSVRVLPRPPKMEISHPTFMDQYYTDEPIYLEFKILNKEDLDAPAKLDAILLGDEAPPFTLEIDGRESQDSSTVGSDESRLLAVPLGAIASSKSLTVRLHFLPIDRANNYDLTVRVVYHLATNPGTPITQTAILQLNIVNPFEANYDLLPRVHPDPWPSFFDYEGVQQAAADDDGNSSSNDAPPAAALSPPKGLTQTWRLVTRYASFASEDLRVLDVDIRLQASQTVRCFSTRLARQFPPGTGQIIKPKTMEEAAFDIVAQKSTLDDRSVAALDVALVIKWARLGSDDDDMVINTTALPVPRYSLFGIEPRVLASVAHISASQQHLVELKVTIENASNHFLTFGLSMEPSDEFAFSGPKQTTVNVLPVSRREVTWRLLPFLINSSDTGGDDDDDSGSDRSGGDKGKGEGG